MSSRNGRLREVFPVAPCGGLVIEGPGLQASVQDADQPVSQPPERVAVLETRLPVRIEPGPDVVLMIDPDLIEQMLINLIRNAVDSALEQAHTATGVEPEVVLRWRQEDASVSLIVEDNGIGLLNPSNAFVPFYTTKQGGSGIGLVLSQQIAEAHGGSIELANRKDTRGCIVTVQLPHRT